MAKENIKKFYEAVAADEGLRNRLNDLNKPYQGETMDEEKKTELVEKLILPVAAEMGWAFSMEELRQYEEEIVQANSNRELDDQELEAVAGGMGGMAGACILIGAGVGVMLPSFCIVIGVAG